VSSCDVTWGFPAWPVDDTCSELECALLSDVLGEVRYLTGKMRQEADTQNVGNPTPSTCMLVTSRKDTR